MSEPTTETLTEDRGLGTAYERHHFYRLVDRWAEEYGATSFLEGPLDGMAGVAGVHGVGLARRGIPVLSLVQTDEQARVTRAVYERAEAKTFDVRTFGGGVAVGPDGTSEGLARLAALPMQDMVVAYHSLGIPNWREYLRTLGRLARKLLVVATCNPDNWGVTFVRATGVLRGVPNLAPPSVWRTDVLAPELWDIGRVRDHVYFDAPWWPDLPVSPGQSLADRVKRLWTTRAKDVVFAGSGHESVLAKGFVYGADKWPYFGGPGWDEELHPALERHVSFEGKTGRLGALTAHLHAFVVDTRPRTPQARRRLEQVAVTKEPEGHPS